NEAVVFISDSAKIHSCYGKNAINSTSGNGTGFHIVLFFLFDKRYIWRLDRVNRLVQLATRQGIQADFT
ncbi:hypothetical protein WI645_05920, partial [Vibrio cholerae]